MLLIHVSHVPGTLDCVSIVDLSVNGINLVLEFLVDAAFLVVENPVLVLSRIVKLVSVNHTLLVERKTALVLVLLSFDQLRFEPAVLLHSVIVVLRRGALVHVKVFMARVSVMRGV